MRRTKLNSQMSLAPQDQGMFLMRNIRHLCLLLFALLVFAIPATSRAEISIRVGFAPPVLPVYLQPVCPQPNLMWTPGYWSYADGGYFWVPGAWVPAPYAGALWTPPYWGWNNGQFVFYDGYWGPHVGYYGGVNYGFGYMGIGFVGGTWQGGVFAYNTAIMRVNTNVIHNTYVNETVIRQNTIVNANHVAYNGGPGGIQHTATHAEMVAAREQHTAPTNFQTQHLATARADTTSYAKANGGHPKTLAVAKPLAVENHAAPSGLKTEAKVRAKAEPKAEPRAARSPEARTAPESKPRATPKVEPRTTAKAEPKVAPKTEERTAPKAEPRTASKPEPRTTAKAEPKFAPKTEERAAPKAEPRSAPKPEPRTTAKAEPREAPKATARPAPRAEPKAAPKAEPKPEPKPR
jgi:hypothetical protein